MHQWVFLLMWNANYWYKVDEFVGVLLKDVCRDAEWVITSVYGPTNANDKADFWVELNQVVGVWNRPWVLGDFNAIRCPTKKRGGCSVSPAMRDFDDWIILHDLVDLPLIRVDFTWSNTQAIPVMSRLEFGPIPSVNRSVGSFSRWYSKSFG